MKKANRIMMTLMVLVLGAAIPGCKKSDSANGSQTVKYTCPMHPEVVKDAQGNCPKCGMKLVEKH